MNQFDGRIPVDDHYEWPLVISRDDYNRGVIDDLGQPWIDGHRVNVAMYERFRREWVEFYDKSACPELNCDGERDHEGKHFAWISE